MKAKLKGGDEYNAFTGWRKYMYWRAGELKSIKSEFNRRQRRTARQQLKKTKEE